MKNTPLEYFDRPTGTIRKEKIYGEGWLRWTYGNPLGRFFLWTVARRAWFSRWYGRRMNEPSSHEKIQPFIERYGVDPTEFLETPDSFRSFNDFFIRRLKPKVRPIAKGEDTVVFPADGRHLGFPDLSRLEGVVVKGQAFDLHRLFGSREAASPYENGAIVLSRLCPVDYHRFHFPATGKAIEPTPISGTLDSVNPIALRQRLSILWENKRNLSYLETERLGRIATFEVGATCVGSISYVKALPGTVEKGEEKGFFSFGGSSVLTLFEPRRITLADDLLEHSAENRETYARMGEDMGHAP